MAALNTYEVNELLHRIAHRQNRMAVLGVFPANHLPSMQRIKHALGDSPLCCLVANTDPANFPGKHWVLFIASLNRGNVYLEYFDSYGLPILMHSALHTACLRTHYLSQIRLSNNHVLQDITSSVCGHYCLLVAYFRANGNSFSGIVSC
jgi:hypothetical protein